jgi:hypothetical protein
MGSFDCYCALCCGPLGLYNIKVGSKRPRALAKREKRVENKARRLKGEDVLHEDSQEWKEEEREEDEKARREEEMRDVEMEDASAVEGNENNDESNSEEETHDGPWDSEEEEIDPVELDEGDSDDDQQEGDSEDSDEHEEEDEDADFADTFSQASELSLSPSFDLAAGCPSESNSMYSYYEKNAYDPTKITRDDVQWLDRARVLAINPEWDGDKKAYLSGRGRYDDLVRSSSSAHAICSSR